MKKQRTNDPENDFIWKSLRISFIVLIVSLVLIGWGELDDVVNTFVGLICLISLQFTFIVSIIHLTKYKEKSFAITALVISAFILFTFLLFMYGKI